MRRLNFLLDGRYVSVG